MQHGLPKDSDLGFMRICYIWLSNYNMKINETWKSLRHVWTLLMNFNIQTGLKAFFKPFSSRVGGCDCVEIKTRSQETSSFLCSLFLRERRRVGWEKRGIPVVSLSNVSVEQNISSSQSIAQKHFKAAFFRELCKYTLFKMFLLG